MANTQAQYWTVLPAVVGKPIAEGVQDFARENGLRVESWVHDLPLWFVSSPVDPERDIVRRVQVAAYSMGTVDELRMIPQVFRFDRQRRLLIAFEESETEEISKIDLWGAIEPKVVKELLARTWANALKLTPPSETIEKNPKRRVVSIEVAPDFRL